MADTQKVEAIAGLSLKTLLVTTIGILLLGIYVGILIFGENSLTVLNHLKEKIDFEEELKKFLDLEEVLVEKKAKQGRRRIMKQVDMKPNIKKQALRQEEKSLKTENQRLQKEYFELKQLEPKE